MVQREKPDTAARPIDLKLNNRRQILEVFRSGSAHSVADVAREIGISRQTVMKAIQFYLDKGIIVSDGKASSGSMGGKRAELFSLSARQCLISVLVCPDGLFMSLFNLRCEVLAEREYKAVAGLSPEALARRAGAMCQQMLTEHGIIRGDVRGVCVSTPGIVAQRTGRLSFNALIPQWGRDVPLAQRIAGCFNPDTVVMIDNVGKVCGGVYLHQRPDLDGRVASVFSAWGGISGCLMQRGHILNGKDSLIGEIGHMMLVPDDPERCGCGGHGCFERQVSAERLRAVAARLAGQYPDSPLNQLLPDTLGIRNVFEASRAGDGLGRALSAYAAGHFASAMRNLTLMFNPDRVVFQGDYAYADDHFRETLYAELKKFNYYPEGGGQQSPFELVMDRRPIRELATLGAYSRLVDGLFSDRTTYI